MEPITIAAILALSLSTAVISGVLGMAGGMILMGALPLFMPLEQAFILHGIIQLASNSQRYAQLAGHARHRESAWYLGGALIAYLALRSVGFTPDRLWVYIALGLLSFVPSIKSLPAADFTRPPVAAVAGLLMNGMQIVCGVAGPILDLFFRDPKLGRYEVIATKALTQSLSHLLKIVFFAEIAARQGHGILAGIAPSTLALCLGATALGTWASRRLLDRITDRSFYSWTLRTLQALGVFYLAKAALLGAA